MKVMEVLYNTSLIVHVRVMLVLNCTELVVY